MKAGQFSKFLGWSLPFVILTSAAWGGQVVTKDAKLWAKKALEEEKSLTVLPSAKTLAVLYFQNKTGQSELDPLQKGLALMLTTDLSNVKDIQVVERIRFQALVEEMGLGVSGLVEPDTAPRVGRLLGARWLIGGAILEAKRDQLQIQSNPLDVPTQEILGQITSQGMLTDLFRIEKDLLFDIIKLLKIEVTPLEEQELRKPCSKSIKALMSLFKGVEASDRGEYEKAAEYYEKALKEDPAICEAKGALQELRSLGHIAVKKKSQEMLRSLRDSTSLTNQLPPKIQTEREPPPNALEKGRPCPACP